MLFGDEGDVEDLFGSPQLHEAVSRPDVAPVATQSSKPSAPRTSPEVSLQAASSNSKAEWHGHAINDHSDRAASLEQESAADEDMEGGVSPSYG